MEKILLLSYITTEKSISCYHNNMKITFILFTSLLFTLLFLLPKTTYAKSYIKSYRRSSGTSVRSYTRYKADGYKFNNYQYGPDRGYRR